MSAITRPPIITVMGHIDHGKSKLLDYIRHANVVEGEAGGITQHLGAYEVLHTSEEHGEQRITFLDTPGHEAFQAIRARGSAVADIAILVVAADEGIKPQTLQALETIKKAGIPYIVALNKIDKPNADVNRVKTELSQHEVYIEEYGGQIPCVAISAITGEGVSDLLDMILLVAALEEYQADPELPATGVVIESDIDPKKGIAATLIITDGTLKSGQYVQAGGAYSPVRIMLDTTSGKSLPEARFSTPIRLIGWSSLPTVGDTWIVHEKKKEAEVAAKAHTHTDRSTEAWEETAGVVTVPLILRADVNGTLEAVKHELAKIKKENLHVKIVDEGVGAITEADVKNLAGKPHSLILGFNVSTERTALEPAERAGVVIKTFAIIYELADWLETYLESARPRQEVQEILGRLKVLKTFSSNKNKHVVGGKVLSGKLNTGATIQVVRGEENLGTGIITGLQAQKVEVKTVGEDNECGVLLECEFELQGGDIIEEFRVVEK